MQMFYIKYISIKGNLTDWFTAIYYTQMNLNIL